MGGLIDIGTRKGLFTLERAGGTAGNGWRIARVSFIGEPVTMTLRDPRDGTLYAALRLGHFGCKLRRSSDGGATWEECAVPEYPAAPEAPGAGGAGDAGKAKGPASLDQIWALETGGAHEPGVLWAGTIPGGLFRSEDRGATWRLVDSLWSRPERAEWFGGGYDEPGIHSIVVERRDSWRITVGVSCGGVWVSEDGGSTWACRAAGMFADYMPPDGRENPNVQDPHRIVHCASAPDAMWAQHHNGVFRTRDGARMWTHVPAAAPSGFGFAVAVHPRDPETAWFAPAVKDECRVPVDGRLVVSRTRDGGRTFEALRNGLPQEHAYDIVYRHALEVDGTGERLAMGSTTGGVWTSENGGDSWTALPARLPPVYSLRFAT